MLHPSIPRRRILAGLAAVTWAVTACGSDSPRSETAGAEGGTTGAGYPVTVESCGEEVTFDAPPERAVVNDNNMVELFFELGLEDKMVAYAGVGEGNRAIQPQYADLYDSVPSLGDDYFTFEPLLGADPDFVFAGWNYGFSEEDGITPEVLADYGIDSYVLTESCRRVVDDLPPGSREDWYTDTRNIAAIFGVPERAEELIDTWEDRIDAVQECLPPEDERDQVVFTLLNVRDDTPSTAPGLTTVPEYDELAGGVSAFADLPAMWGPVSWEAVVDSEPDLIVVVDYGTGPDGEDKIAALEDHPAMSEVPAVRDERYLVLPQNAVNPGPRLAEGIELRSAALYPDTCGDLADASPEE